MREILKPKLSVIVIVYNLEKYVEEGLESVVNQTYKDMQIVVVNGSSTDKSTEICRRYAEKYPNITLVECENKGLGGNRNTGMQHAKGEYIAFVDGDDILDFDMYRQMMEYMENDNLDAVFCSFKRFYNDDVNNNNINVIAEKFCYDKAKMWQEIILPIIVNTDSTDVTIGTMWSVIYKKNIIDENNLFVRHTYEILSEDIYFNTEYLALCKRVKVINKPLYFYRMRSNSISNSVPSHKIPSLARFCREIIEFGIANGISREEMEKRIRVYLLLNTSSIYRKQTEVLSLPGFCKYVKETLSENNIVLTYNKDDLKYTSFQVKLYRFLMKNKLYRILYFLTKFYSKFIMK